MTLYSHQRKIHQEDITVLNIYVPKAMTYKFIKDTLLQVKLHVDPHTVIWGEFPLITIKKNSDKSKQRNGGVK